MSYTPEQIEAALSFRKVSYDEKTADRIKELRKEVDRKSEFLLSLFNAIDNDYKNHSKTGNPFSNPAVRETESGITYFEFNVELNRKKHLFQIEICGKGYFVNEPCEETFLPDDLILSGRMNREEQPKTLFSSDVSIAHQVLRGYATCACAGPMTDIENRVLEKLGVDGTYLGIQTGQKPESIIESIENAEKFWDTFVSSFRKSPHPALFVQ